MCILLLSNISGLIGILKVFLKDSTVTQHWNERLLCVENHGNGIGIFFILMMPTSVAGEMITILYFLAKKQQSALQDLRKEETHKLTKLCCLLSARHLENNCLSSCQAISQRQEKSPDSSELIWQNLKQRENSRRGPPLRHPRFIQSCLLVLDRGSGEQPWECCVVSALAVGGKVQIPTSNLRNDLEVGTRNRKLQLQLTQFISQFVT